MPAREGDKLTSCLLGLVVAVPVDGFLFVFLESWPQLNLKPHSKKREIVALALCLFHWALEQTQSVILFYICTLVRALSTKVNSIQLV